MKLKYYLRGLGIGIICTAIIMGIALSGKEKLTNAEIIERARLLGMVMAEEQNEEDEAQNDVKDETAENDQKNAENNQVPEVKNEEPQTPDEAPITEPEIKTIEVKKGEYSDVVSQKLFEAGLIPDAAAFNKYLMDSGLDQSIMVGVHQIPMGAAQDEIIKILGEKPQ